MNNPAIDRAKSLDFAQPYSTDAIGFYFNEYDEYLKKSSTLRDSNGSQVEEFEIQFTDGDPLECALFKAVGVYQSNLKAYLEFIDQANEINIIELIIADDAGYTIDLDHIDFDIDVYPNTTLNDLAEQFLDEGLFGDIPDNIRHYIDEDAIARDLGMDYTELQIGETQYTYRMA